MRKLFISFLLSICFSATIVAQKADIVHQPQNRQSVPGMTLYDYKLTASAGLITIDISDIHPVGPAYTYEDLYYNVYLRLINPMNAVTEAALLETVTIPCTLDVVAANGNSQFITSLSVSKDIDRGEVLYHFSKEQTGNLNRYDITQVTLSFPEASLNSLHQSILELLQPEVYVEIGRYITGTSTPGIATYSVHNPAGSLKENEVMIYWDDVALEKPAYFELEWIHLQADSWTANTLDIDFTKNARRVQTDKNYYPLSIIYEDGYIVSRVRTVRYLLNEDASNLIRKKEYSPWSIPNSTTSIAYDPSNPPPASNPIPDYYSVLDLTGTDYDHFDNFNWEYRAVYSNQGKKKEVLQFYDGSLRNRQNLTLLSSFESSRSFNDKLANVRAVNHVSNVVAEEVYYDYNGNEIIKILPAPLLEASKIAYQENINRYQGAKLGPATYDNASTGAFYSPLDVSATEAGAAQYYSIHNQLLGSVVAADFIPDAAGLPYTRNEYLEDGSGRLKAVYAAGDGFANNADASHSTRFSYAKPTQAELNLLLGTNAGLANSYKKNATVDPNGVTSLAYIDAQDRTVATSLVGGSNTETGLGEVAGPAPTLLEENLYANGALRYNEETYTYELSYPIFVAASQAYIFNYALNAERFVTCFSLEGSVCYSCNYDISFQIIDEENNLLLDVVNGIVGAQPQACDEVNRSFTGFNHNTLGATISNNELSVPLTALKKYTIIQRLQLKTDLLETYTEDYLTNPSCPKDTEEDFIKLELDNSDFTSCTEYYEDPCGGIVDAMKADFRYPYGAFVVDAPKDAEIVEYILMRTRREVNCTSRVATSAITADPQTPEEEAEKAYRDAIKQDFLNEFDQEYSLNGQQPTFAQFNEDFIDFFLQYHPSYCKLNACRALRTRQSLAFDRLLEESTTIDDFVVKALAEKNAGNTFWSHVPATASLTPNTTTGEIVLANFSQDIWNGSWMFDAAGNFSDQATVDASNNPQDVIDFKSDLALLPYDKTLIDYCNANDGAISYGVFEPQMFPSSKEAYFYLSDGTTLFGQGSFKNINDMFYLLFGYFSLYDGIQNQVAANSYDVHGIADIAFNIADPNALISGTSNPDVEQQERWWSIYKGTYAVAKERFIEDMINNSSCIPKDPNYPTPDNGTYPFDFITKDANAGDPVSGNNGYGGSWQWDRAYAWGEWWTNAWETNPPSCSSIYLGKEPENELYSDLVVFDEPTTSQINQKIKDDLLELLEGSEMEEPCLGELITAINGGGANTFIGKDFIEAADPFYYLSQRFNTTGCNAYELNLSVVTTPYLKYFKNQSGGNYFTKSLPEEVQVNCKDFELATQSSALPAALSIPALPNGEEDIAYSNLDQRSFKNWLNYKFGLNLSFRDYFEFEKGCAGDGNTSIFQYTVDWDLSDAKTIAMKEAINSYGNVAGQYWVPNKSNPTVDLFTTMNNNLSGYTVSSTNDYLNYGQVDLEDNHHYLFYLENRKTLFSDLRSDLGTVFNALRTELNSLVGGERKYPDFEEAYTAQSRLIENVAGTTLNLSNSVDVKIDRAVLYANGTIWVRLIDATNEDLFVDDFYYHYKAHNTATETEYQYFLSDLLTHSSFSSIEPVFNDVSIHYVYLYTSDNKKLLASTTGEIAEALRIGKLELNEIQGEGEIPLLPSCEDRLYERARLEGATRYQEYLDGLADNFKHDYLAFCSSDDAQGAFTQSLSMEYNFNEKHFTLYEYDQANNLVATVPPAGIAQSFDQINPVTGAKVAENVSYSAALAQQMDNYRHQMATDLILPKHTRKTTYQYNSYNQVIIQTTPNGGTSLFWYDEEGRPVLSQNNSQRINRLFSYTFYDQQSRVVETGEVLLPQVPGFGADMMYQYGATPEDIWRGVHTTLLTGFIEETPIGSPYAYDIEQQILASERNYVVRTYYDDKQALPLPPGDFEQKNLRSRVATQAYFSQVAASSNNYDWDYASHYSYDAVGNVTSILNDYYQAGSLDNEAHRFKRIDYEYDAVNGNLLRLYYQLGKEDAFFHHYEYDAENRITKVKTSRDGVIWDEDATYDYYLHGPLAKTELGEHKVQGIDYAYTLQGWLKAVNAGLAGEDMGADKANAIRAEDAFGFSLQYFNGDYSPIGGSSSFLANHPTSLNNLYNGNIAAQSLHNKETTLGKAYTYDQLNRILAMEEREINTATWASSMNTGGLASAYQYDGNGNLTSLHRYNGMALQGEGTVAETQGVYIDKMDYHYPADNDLLNFVSDQIVDDPETDEDNINTENFQSQESGNYAYDLIGNLVKDEKNGIETIHWYPNGKIKRVERYNPTAANPDLYFEYDAMNNRVKKEVSFVEDGRYFLRVLYYVYDAGGKLLATYDEKDCRFEDPSDQDKKFYYQYSHDFSYYLDQVITTIGQNELLDFLMGVQNASAQSFSKTSELKNTAYAQLSNISDAKGIMWPYVDAVNYLTQTPDAVGRAFSVMPVYYSLYMYNNHFTDFLSIVNYQNEAWIEALKVSGNVSNFYTNYHEHYNNTYDAGQKLSNAQNVYQMNRSVMLSLIIQDADLFKRMLGISSTQYSDLLDTYYNPTGAYASLKSLLEQLYQESTGGVQTSSIEDLIREINGMLMIMSPDGDQMGSLLNNVSLPDLYTFMNSTLNTEYADLLNAVLHHLRVYYVVEGLTSPIASNDLNDYLPTAALIWTEDSNGDLLPYYLHTGVANSVVRTAAEAYFTSFSMSNYYYYFVNASTAKAYVVPAMEAHTNNAVLIAAMKHNDNINVTKGALYSSESVANVATYFKNNHYKEMLEMNLVDDRLLAAFNNLSNYSPLDLGEELMSYFNSPALVFETLEDCNALGNVRLVAESFSLYGSSRLGLMDAAKPRRDSEDPDKYSRELGAKTYELNDHLGNVMATISDKKLHPQELVPPGDQSYDLSQGFQAEVQSRSDRYPFGLEITERSNAFSSINTTADGSAIVYSGLLDACSDYQVNSGATQSCTTSTDVYGKDYVSSYTATCATNCNFDVLAKIPLEEAISNLDPEAIYRLEIHLSGTYGRNLSGKSDGGNIAATVSSASAGSGASATEIAEADDKIISLELSGQEWLDAKWGSNDYIRMRISLGTPLGSSYSNGLVLENIFFFKRLEGSSVALAQRAEGAYRYGFQGQEVDAEWSGVDFGGGELAAWDFPIENRVILNEDFSDLSFWEVGEHNATPCASISGGQLLLEPGTTNCGVTSKTLYLETGETYRLSFDADNTGGNTVLVVIQAQEEGSEQWTLRSQDILSTTAGTTSYRRDFGASTYQKYRILIYYTGSINATNATYVDNILLRKYLNWTYVKNERADIENGRLKFVSDEVNEEIYTDEITLRTEKMGVVHTLSYEAEWLGDALLNSKVIVQEQLPSGGWQQLEEQSLQTIANSGVTEMTLTFVPTEEIIRLRFFTPGAGVSSSNVLTLYFDNFKITDGTTAPISKGSLPNKVAFKYRVHDASIGRFLSIDPLASDYPWNSPYAFAENRVIDGADLEGAEYINNSALKWRVYAGEGELSTPSATLVIDEANTKTSYPNMYMGLLQSGIYLQPDGEGSEAIGYSFNSKRFSVLTKKTISTKKFQKYSRSHKQFAFYKALEESGGGGSGKGAWFALFSEIMAQHIASKQRDANGEFNTMLSYDLMYAEKVGTLMSNAYFMNLVPQEVFWNEGDYSQIANMLLSRDEHNYSNISDINRAAFSYLWWNKESILSMNDNSLRGNNPFKTRQGGWKEGYSSNDNQLKLKRSSLSGLFQKGLSGNN
jgi:hypothetical protein